MDVLTLTATPIPRTMHMSLIGIRDMSVLEEAPQDRQPIQTFVCEYNEEMVREAINRELARGGQVYYVYNRVQSIADMANTIQKLVPDANVGFAHGQMKERELEKIMYGFINGEIDVLVSTTIIETGLDISNVNTMIIHDSDQMGLSQLYQLRGRVGRSNRTSYAFLMYRRNKMLKEVAEKRLHAIREFTEMGSGFKIAMRDLEIRGAGNLLGAEQSGHMESVGYDLYCKMLAEAVQEAKGIAPAEAFETTIDLNVSAYIPDSYISNESLKLDTYKRIAAIENKEEYEDMTEELTDRFGNRRKMYESSGCCRTESAGALCVCDGAETDGRFGTSHLTAACKNRCGADSGAAAEIPRRTEIPDGVAGVCLHAAAEKFKGKDRSAGEEPCTGGRSAADHAGVKHSHTPKIV